MDIKEILTLVGGIVSGGGLTWLVSWRQRVRVAKAEADATVSTGYEARIAELHQTVKYLNETTTEQAQRIKDLNHGLDDKTDRIRDLTERVWEAEQAQNRLNADLLRCTEERDEYRRLMEHYRDWRCEDHECGNRRPPRRHSGPYVAPAATGRQPSQSSPLRELPAF